MLRQSLETKSKIQDPYLRLTYNAVPSVSSRFSSLTIGFRNDLTGDFLREHDSPAALERIYYRTVCNHAKSQIEAIH